MTAVVVTLVADQALKHLRSKALQDPLAFVDAVVNNGATKVWLPGLGVWTRMWLEGSGVDACALGLLAFVVVGGQCLSESGSVFLS